MAKYIKRFIFWGTLVSLLVGGIIGVRLLPGYLEELGAPPELHLLDGPVVSGVPDIIDSETQIILVVMFSAKCSSCAEHMRGLNAIHDPPYVYVVGINIGDNDSEIRIFVEYNSIDFPIICGIRRAPEGVSSVPLTALMALGPQGWQTVREWTGAAMPQEVIEYINGFYDWLEEQIG